MKKLSAALLATLFAISSLCSADQTPQSLQTEITHKVDVRFMLHLPKGYEEATDKNWPMILFLHGAGERGDDLQKVTVHGPPKLVKNGKELGFIIVSPQCPKDTSWDNRDLIALLDHVQSSYRVDRDRTYLTGLSMGGYGTWSLGLRNPLRFAAIAPVCGGGVTIDTRLARRDKTAPLNQLPIWAFHGGKDSVVPPEESARLVDLLKKNNPQVKLTIYPEASHDSWTATYDNPELYEWFLSHSLKDRK